MSKKVARQFVLEFQRRVNLFPKSICLVSGAPRSGTTALVDWLGDQPGVAAFQESRILVSAHAFMEEVWRFSSLSRDSLALVRLARRLIVEYYTGSRILIGKRLLVDKEPLEPIAFPSRDYEQFIKNIKTLFPEAKLLLAVRDPLATIWSMSQRPWGESLTNREARDFAIEEYTHNWNSCADLILQCCSNRNTCIVQFGRLMNDPENESRRICEFLSIRNGKPFEPRETKDIGFSREEREQIVHATRSRVELLNAKGISGL